MRLSLRGTKNWASTPARRTPDNTPPVSKAEFRQLCARLKITDNETAAELFGVSWRTCQRYWYGETPVPEPLARLLRLAVIHKMNHHAMLSLRTIAPKKP